MTNKQINKRGFVDGFTIKGRMSCWVNENIPYTDRRPYKAISLFKFLDGAGNVIYKIIGLNYFDKSEDVLFQGEIKTTKDFDKIIELVM